MAVHNGNESMARLLLEKNADPDISNDMGLTPLHSALLTQNESIARLLLEKNANPTIRNKACYVVSPFTMARGKVARAREEEVSDRVRIFESIVEMCEDTVRQMSGKENKQQQQQLDTS
jgi:ankyrin repeat protein